MPTSELRILFVALVNNVGCERVIADMAAHGAVCALMSPPGYYCTKTKSVSVHFSIPNLPSVWVKSLFVRAKLESVAQDWRPTLVVPLDDIAAWLLRSLATNPGASSSLRDLLVRSFGSPSGYRAAIGRKELMELASRLGIRKPHHLQVDSISDSSAVPEGWGFPLFLKTEHSCGGDGVRMVSDGADLRQQLQRMMCIGPSRRIAWLVKRFLCTMAGFQLGSETGVLIQSFATGIPAFRTVAAWEGRVLSGISLAAQCVHPKPTGASTIVRLINNSEMDETAIALTAALGCSGFVSYDFLLDEEQGRASLIEMNPRCVGSCHLGRFFGEDVCGALVAFLKGVTAPANTIRASVKQVALFPKEIERDPSSPYLRSSEVFHDVPRDEPALISAYVQRLLDIHPAQSEDIIRMVQEASK